MNNTPKQTEDILKEWAYKIQHAESDDAALEMVKAIHLEGYQQGVLKQFIKKDTQRECKCNCAQRPHAPDCYIFHCLHATQEKCHCGDGCPTEDVCCGEKLTEKEQEDLIKELDKPQDTQERCLDCTDGIPTGSGMCEKHSKEFKEMYGPKPQDTESWEKKFDEKFIEGLNFYALQLSPRETKILEMRFGKVDGVTHTLEEAGKEFGVTRERIRQIEEKAMEKLRQKEEIKSFIKDLLKKEREKEYEKAVAKLALGAKNFDTKQTRTQTIDEIIGMVEVEYRKAEDANFKGGIAHTINLLTSLKE